MHVDAKKNTVLKWWVDISETEIMKWRLVHVMKLYPDINWDEVIKLHVLRSIKYTTHIVHEHHYYDHISPSSVCSDKPF